MINPDHKIRLSRISIIRDKAISRTDNVRRFMCVSVEIRERKGLLSGKIVFVESPNPNISADIHLFYDKFVTG